MKKKILFVSAALLMFAGTVLKAQKAQFNAPIVTDETIFEEKGGIVAVEAEYFYKQSKSEVRQWYRTSKNEAPKVGRDDDDQHCYGASNNAYLEILPDTRVTHSDKLVQGENYTEAAGTMAVVHYKVKINTPGRYYVWARAFCTGSEDNGLHVGLNGEWPEHGRRMQWCEGRGHWTWGSKQRTAAEHCGVPKQIYFDIKKTGVHDIQFSMREDGFEFDKFILTNDSNYIPVELGPKTIVAKGKLPAAYPAVEAPAPPVSYFTQIAASNKANKVLAAQSFPSDGTQFYKDGKNWLAINPKMHTEATTSKTFEFETGNYDIVFVGVGENDGSSTLQLFINDKEIGTYLPPLTTRLFEEGKSFNALWQNVTVKKGDKITVNAKIGSTDGKEHTRGRWAGIIFAPVGKGKQVQEAPSSFTAQ